MQRQLGSGIMTVVYAGSCSSDSTPGLGTSIYQWCSHKKKKKKNQKNAQTHKKIGFSMEQFSMEKILSTLIGRSVHNTVIQKDALIYSY